MLLNSIIQIIFLLFTIDLALSKNENSYYMMNSDNDSVDGGNEDVNHKLSLWNTNGHVYDAKYLQVLLGNKIDNFDCSNKKDDAHYEHIDCRKYWHCLYVGTLFEMAFERKCPIGTMFHPIQGFCEISNTGNCALWKRVIHGPTADVVTTTTQIASTKIEVTTKQIEITTTSPDTSNKPVFNVTSKKSTKFQELRLLTKLRDRITSTTSAYYILRIDFPSITTPIPIETTATTISSINSATSPQSLNSTNVSVSDSNSTSTSTVTVPKYPNPRFLINELDADRNQIIEIRTIADDTIESKIQEQPTSSSTSTTKCNIELAFLFFFIIFLALDH